MRKSYFHLGLAEFKEKFSNFFQHKKKVKALQHLNETKNFRHQNYLMLIKECLNDGFLENEEEQFLEFMLRKYEINYLEWCHKTKWLKEQIQELAEQNTEKAAQIFFDMDKPREQKNKQVPLEVLINNQRGYRQGARC